MKFFLDTADLDEIQRWCDTGLIDGVTTNPSLMAKNGLSREDCAKKICHMVPGPVSVEVLATEADAMVQEGLALSQLAPHVVVKLPTTLEGLQACVQLRRRNIPTNMTLCFSLTQALWVAKAGATYVSPFVGRLEDQGEDGLGLVQNICHMYRQYKTFHTQVLVASVRHRDHVAAVAGFGADVVTLPPAILETLAEHPLTTKGLEKFLQDAQSKKEAR